jgi:hypothetical protein
MIKGKLLGYKTIKLGGVKFTIRKLTPALFLDEDSYPLNNIIEKMKNNADIGDAEVNLYKDTIKKIILKAVVNIGFWFDSKKIDLIIDDIMEAPELYNALFVNIMNHSFGVKKNNLAHWFSPEPMRHLFTA